jgi:tetratricopeptide (TPR) repeat protein
MTLMRSVMLLSATLALAAPGAAHAGWLQAKSRHFIVYSDGSQKQLAAFAEKLEKFDFLLRKMTGTPEDEAPNPVLVYALPTALKVQAVARHPMIAGFYTTSDRHAVAVVSREAKNWQFDVGPEDILFHEYAHHFMLHYFPSAYPAWYVEGFAEFYSVVTFPENGSIRFGNIPLARVPDLVTMPLYPLDQLFAKDTDALTRQDGGRYYGTAWLLTHYFRYNEKRGAEFRRYLTDMVKGVPGVTPDAYFEGGIKALEKELRAYMKGRIPASTFTPEELPAFSIAVTPLEDAQGALMSQELLLLGDDLPDAEKEKLATEVRAKAARYPASAYAQALLADVELRLDNADAALAAAERAITIDANYARPWSTKATVLLERADRSDKAEDWKAAVAAIVRANRADMEDPVPLMQFYRYRMMRGGEMPKVGYDGVTKAFGLLPQNAEYRITYAMALAQQSSFTSAADILAPLAFSPHASAERDAAAKLRDQYLARISDTPPVAEKPPE